MSRVSLQRVAQPDDRSLPIFEQVDRVAARIRERAFDLSRTRDLPGGPLDDWLRAEREVCWPAAELTERGREFELRVTLPGFESREVTVTATPRELIVHAAHEHSRKSRDDEWIVWSEFGSNDVCRRVELPAEIDVEGTTARLDGGVLRIVAGKRATTVGRETVGAAA